MRHIAFLFAVSISLVACDFGTTSHPPEHDGVLASPSHLSDLDSFSYINHQYLKDNGLSVARVSDEERLHSTCTYNPDYFSQLLPLPSQYQSGDPIAEAYGSYGYDDGCLTPGAIFEGTSRYVQATESDRWHWIRIRLYHNGTFIAEVEDSSFNTNTNVSEFYKVIDPESGNTVEARYWHRFAYHSDRLPSNNRGFMWQHIQTVITGSGTGNPSS